MKIAHVVDSMEVGGAETLVLQMCRLQREQRHDPSVYAIAALGALGEQMQREGFSVRANVGEHLVDTTRKFLQLFRETRPEVVHLHNPTPTIYAAAAARLSGVPSIVSTRHSLVAPPLNAMMEAKYGIAARFFDWAVGICDATTNNMKRVHNVPKRKIVRIYNGAIPLLRTSEDQLPPKDGFTLIYVGRLAPVKNHELLLHAFRAAQSSMTGLRLWMVGDGTERIKLESLATELGIASVVKFWGQQLDVAPFFSAADAFIMSSKSEGLPMSLLQALSLGIPAVVTDVGGMAEVVRLADAGYTVSVANHSEMTAAILKLASNKEDWERFSKNAKAGFSDRFSLQTMVDGYMGLYRNTKRFRL